MVYFSCLLWYYYPIDKVKHLDRVKIVKPQPNELVMKNPLSLEKLFNVFVLVTLVSTIVEG